MPSRRVGVAASPFAFVVGAALALGACAPQAASDATAPATPATSDALEHVPFAARFGVDGVYRLDQAVPLAFRRHTSLRVAKGDQYDNKRAADPENYTVTAPPADIAHVRPMTEWEPMRALVFAYPSYAAQLDQASDTFVNIAKNASDYGEVWVLVDGTQAQSIFEQKLARADVPGDKLGKSIKFWRVPFDTYWFIDYGPLPLIDTSAGTYAFGDFRYYHERPLDDAIPTLLGRNTTQFGEMFPATTYRMPLTVEGGTFQATTDGVCITGSREIYNLSCDAGACKDSILSLSLTDLKSHPYTLEMRGVLQAYAGCKDLIVTHSITDDGTGHIDMYLKILDDHRILLGQYERPYGDDYEQENAGLLDDTAAFLEAYVKADGSHFQVLRLPMPGHRTVQDWFGNYDVPFTYINSTFFNGLNLWPAYSFPEWVAGRDEAEAVWQQVMPDMKHVWVDAEELSYESGAIHCVTRTIPKQKPHPWLDDGDCTEGGTCAGVDGGYDGQCALGGATDLCWGPQWLCGCNDCRDCPAVIPDEPCNGVPYAGCCDGGDVLFCQNAHLQKLSCAGTGCGWDAGQGYYSCGLGGEDPSGAAPAACGCTPQCDAGGMGSPCGSDGCGGSCGTCDADSQCVGGVCRDDCLDCTPGEMGCDGTVSWRCVVGVGAGCNTHATVDCAANGLTCNDGDCVSVAVADPEPDVAEATGDATAQGDANGDAAATGGDVKGDANAGDGGPIAEGAEGGGDVSAIASGGHDAGCAGGATAGLSFVASALGLVCLRGRSRRARAPHRA